MIWGSVVFFAYWYIAEIYQPNLRWIAPDIISNLNQMIADINGDKVIREDAEPVATNDSVPSEAYLSWEEISETMKIRADAWELIMIGAMGLSFFLCLTAQLYWRFYHGKPVSLSYSIHRIKSSFLNLLYILFSIHIVLGTALFMVGFSADKILDSRLLWYNIPFGLSLLAFFLSSRLAAPATISGRGCFFARI